MYTFVKNKKQVSLDEVSDKTEVRVDASLATQPLMDAYVDNLTNFNLKKDYTITLVQNIQKS